MMIQNNISFNFVKEIVGQNKKLKKIFRYFDFRDERCFDNHLYHAILSDPDPVGYGHLDYEDGKVWLGMCVFDACVGKGYCKTIFNTLLGNRRTYSTFDSRQRQFKAINLYLSNG